MSRPRIVSATGSKVQIEIPTGWFVNLSAVSRRIYNQLVAVDYVVNGDPRTNFLVNKFGEKNLNQTMRDTESSENVVTIIPQGEKVLINISTYFSTTGSIKEETLLNNKYQSSRLNIIGAQKPDDAPPEFPDYSTFLIFVEDATPATQVQGAPEYDDALVTVNIMQGEVAPGPPPPDTGSQAIAETGKQAITGFIDIYTDPSKPGPTIPPEVIVPGPVRPPSPYPVLILGAGVGGLYTAMMLQSLGIKYEIMEGSGRVGGRLYTHYFPKNSGPYQYYDVGAMRYPETTFMTRTFELAKKRLGLNMLPYIRSDEGDDPFLSYNGITVTKKEAKNLVNQDVFKVTTTNDGYVPEEWFKRGGDYFWDVILGELRQYFVDLPFPEAFEKLKAWEEHSVRSYLLLVKKVPYPVVQWYETTEARTGLFDEALSETVLASLVFNDPNYKGKQVKWWCFDGGSEVLHKAMTEKLSVKPQLYMRATEIKESDNGDSLTVTFDSSRNPRPSAQGRTERKYSNIISTMSFGCLRMVDLEHLYLSYGQKNAIRQLNYTPSIKIGLQFKTAWWEKLGIVGGQSSTDRPIRDVVYPSYGPDASHPNGQKSNCMIASYNGMQDSQRIGGLMKGRDSPEEKILLDLVMKDLARVHKVDVEKLWDEYEDYYPWDFYRDEYQLGAFCQFGPGQFKYTYPYVTQPASKQQRFHFAGDACSTFHGWVAGALNSSWRAVNGMLVAHPELNPTPNDPVIPKFKKEWGDSEEWDQRTLETLTYLNREITKLDLQGSKP